MESSSQANLVKSAEYDENSDKATTVSISNSDMDTRTTSIADLPLQLQSPESYTVQAETELDSENGFKMYKRRWIGMLAIICLNLSTGLVWLTFNAVSKISAEWQHVSLSLVNLSVILYFVGYIVMSSFSGYVFEKWGIKKALIIGGMLNLIGTWIRYFGSFIESSDESYLGRLVVVLIGQFIAATGQPFFLNAPPKFSAVWFSDSSRTTATTIGSVSNPIGAAVAMILVPALCSDPSGEDMPFTLLIIGILSVVALIPAILMPASPPTPPSASAAIALEEAADETFWVATKKLISSHGQFWILFTAFAVFVGFFNSVSSLINQIVVPYEYSDDDAGLFGACLIAAGIFGAAVAGVYVDKTKNYKLVLRLATPFLALAYVGFVFVVEKDSFVWICLICCLIGFCSFGMLPVALELGIECTYPLPASTSTSVLWMGGQTLAVIFLIVGDLMRDMSPFKDEPKDTMRTGLICVAAIAVLISISSFAFNSPYYRMEAEKERARENNNASRSQNLEQLS